MLGINHGPTLMLANDDLAVSGGNKGNEGIRVRFPYAPNFFIIADPHYLAASSFINDWNSGAE